MSIWNKLFGSKDQTPAPSSRPSDSPAKQKARCQIWFANREDCDNHMRLRMVAQANNLGDYAVTAIYEGRYSIEANTEDGRGGYFVRVY